MAISTGYVSGLRGPTDGTPRTLIPAPGKTILFDPESSGDTEFSPTFLVSPGKAVLIDTYNMPFNRSIYVNRVVKSTLAAPVGDSCDPLALSKAYGAPGEIINRERMMLGSAHGPWRLIKFDGVKESESVLQLLITVPGLYELELEETAMLGDMTVEYSEWALAQTPYLPGYYQAGHGGL